MFQFPITPRRLQRGQGQDSSRRPAHAAVLATPRHCPVVELLHPSARDPEARPLPLLVVGEVPPPPVVGCGGSVATLLEVADHLLDRGRSPHPLRGTPQKSPRRLPLPFPR